MLSKGELDILEKIVGYGGYVTKEVLHLYRRDISLDGCYRILMRLEEKKYLRKRDYFRSSRSLNVYQVTRKACNHFGRPEAFMRKVHKAYAVRRYLIRSHFLFMQTGQRQEVTLYTSDERAFYMKGIGYSNFHLPKKVNGNVRSIQMEEYILGDSDDSSTHFLYVDSLRCMPKIQLQMLLLRYERMIRAGITFIYFDIVVESESRKQEFDKAYQLPEIKTLLHAKIVSIGRNYDAQGIL